MTAPMAFLGLGLMGAPIARRLIGAGYPLTLWNRSASKARDVAGAGAIASETAAQAVEGAKLVFLCLTDAEAIESVLFGAGRVADAIDPDATIVDFSTSSPAQAAALARRLKETRGADWLDCPVSGGVAGANDGTLVVMAGGEAGVLDAVRPVLTAAASRVTRMGEVGAGQAAKLCNQLIVSANLLAIAEAVALGRVLGIDTSKLPVAFAGGFADSRPLQVFGPRMAAPDDSPPVSEIRTMAKDVRAILAASVGAAPELELPLTERVAASYATALSNDLGAEDLPALMRLYGNRETAVRHGK